MAHEETKPSALNRQADELAARGDWSAAAEDVNLRLLGEDPENTTAISRLARCLLAKGDKEAAEELYQRLLSVDPSNVIARNFMRRVTQARDAVIAEEKLAAQAARKANVAAKRAAKLAAQAGG